MTARVRIAGFAALLAAVFGLATLAGGAVDPKPRTRAPAAHMEMTADGPGEHAEMSGAPGGLSLAEGGYRLAIADGTLRPGHAQALRFRILGRDGRPVRDFEDEHGAKLHLILARRDLTGYQHLHPRLARDGTWSIRVTLPAAGAYRMFADFHTAGKALTLGGDLLAPGSFRPRPLPAPVTRTRVDGYDVALRETSRGALHFEVSRGGREIRDLQPYLGARGHLVALRSGDLAYLHVHPEEGPTPGAGISFHAEYPSAGRYRLFLQFKHDGRVHTTAFTREVNR
jgi:hypothetical protein